MELSETVLAMEDPSVFRMRHNIACSAKPYRPVGHDLLAATRLRLPHQVNVKAFPRFFTVRSPDRASLQ
jgi:hypothetical protein